MHLSSARRRSAGLTLIELMLAVSGLALIGGAITSMLFAVAYGTTIDKDMRSLVTRQMALRARITAAVRESQMVLDQGDEYIVLWVYDSDESGKPNVEEIQLIEYVAADSELLSYRSPATAGTNTEYDLGSDFRSVTTALKGSADFPQTRWASDVTAFAFSIDEASPQDARLVSFEVTLLGGEIPDTSIGAAALRNGSTP